MDVNSKAEAAGGLPTGPEAAAAGAPQAQPLPEQPPPPGLPGAIAAPKVEPGAPGAVGVQQEGDVAAQPANGGLPGAVPVVPSAQASQQTGAQLATLPSGLAFSCVLHWPCAESPATEADALPKSRAAKNVLSFFCWM